MGHSVFVLLGLWRICGIVTLRGVGLNLLVSPGRFGALLPQAWQVPLITLLSVLILYRESKSSCFGLNHPFSERELSHQLGQEGWAGSGSARIPGLARLLEHWQRALALSLLIPLWEAQAHFSTPENKGPESPDSDFSFLVLLNQ